MFRTKDRHSDFVGKDEKRISCLVFTQFTEGVFEQGYGEVRG